MVWAFYLLFLLAEAESICKKIFQFSPSISIFSAVFLFPLSLLFNLKLQKLERLLFIPTIMGPMLLISSHLKMKQDKNIFRMSFIAALSIYKWSI